jgi:Lon-like protease
VKITFERKGKKKTVQLALKPFPENPKRVGIGISLVTDSEIVTNPSVEIKSEEIGGPSAGLMFSLEIYDQLVEEDITKGYTIAGTGTINEKGEVGPIGGISQKIIAADKAGADIFFAPNEKGAKDSNYQEALKTAKDIGTKMKIVPVDTFDDALRYLQTLK